MINTRAKINCREDEIRYLLESLIFKKKGFLDRIKNIDKRIDDLSKEYSDIKRTKDVDM